MNVLLMVLQGINLVAAEIVPIEQLVEKVRGYFALNPDVKVNVQNLTSAALEADAETVVMVAQWQRDHGLTVTVPQPAPVPGLAPDAK
jgi:hypothetical protein